MATPKTISIPRQLMLLVGMALAVTVAATALYFFSSNRIFRDSTAMTTATVARLNDSYVLM